MTKDYGAITRSISTSLRGLRRNTPDVMTGFDALADAAMSGALPDRITIFRVPLEEDFDDGADLEEEIRITVLHELGHYFGLDEDRLAELGYE